MAARAEGNSVSRTPVFSVALAGLLLIPVSVLSVYIDIGEPWSPFPIPQFIAVALLGPLGFAMLPAFFWMTAEGLHRGRIQISKLAFYIAVAVQCLSVLHIIVSWEDAMSLCGREHLVTVTALSTATGALVLMLLAFCRRVSSFPLHLCARWLFYAWFGWCSFPWLGEAV